MSHPGICFCLKCTGLQGAPVLLSRMHLLENVASFYLMEFNSSSACLQFYIVNYLSKHQKEKITVHRYSMSMFTTDCHSVTRTARWLQMCEKALPQTSIWMSSGTDIPAWVYSVCIGCVVHYRVCATISMSPFCQQEIMWVSMKNDRNWGCVLLSTVMLLFHETLF